MIRQWQDQTNIFFFFFFRSRIKHQLQPLDSFDFFHWRTTDDPIYIYNDTLSPWVIPYKITNVNRIINITKIAWNYKKIEVQRSVDLTCVVKRGHSTDKRQRHFCRKVFFSATIVLNFIRANFCSSAMWNVLDIFYEQIYARNNGYSAGRTKYRHRKKKIIFLKPLKQQFSLNQNIQHTWLYSRLSILLWPPQCSAASRS